MQHGRGSGPFGRSAGDARRVRGEIGALGGLCAAFLAALLAGCSGGGPIGSRPQEPFAAAEAAHAGPQGGGQPARARRATCGRSWRPGVLDGIETHAPLLALVQEPPEQ